MNAKGLRAIAYLITSQEPWQPGRNVLAVPSVPAWQNEYAYTANRAIMRMINDSR